MSDREIVDDLKQQKMEKVVMQELADSPVSIKKSGLFKDIDARFGAPEDAMPSTGGTAQGGMPPIGGGAPSMGGIPPSGGLPSIGGEGGNTLPAQGGMSETPPIAENMKMDEYNKHLEEMIFGSRPETEQRKTEINKRVIFENNEINETLNNNAEKLIHEVDLLIENGNTINSEHKEYIVEDIEIDGIEDIDLTD